MMWVFLCTFSLAMTFMRLGALTVMVMYFRVVMKILMALVFLLAGLICMKLRTRRQRKVDHLI